MSGDKVISSHFIPTEFRKKELIFFIIKMCLEPARIRLLRDDKWILMVSPEYLYHDVTSKTLRVLAMGMQLCWSLLTVSICAVVQRHTARMSYTASFVMLTRGTLYAFSSRRSDFRGWCVRRSVCNAFAFRP